MDASTALDRVESGVVKVLDALGAAWVTFQLYPNPTEQLPFLRAVETINAEATGSVVGVGPGVFIVDEEIHEPRREGVEKFARRLFLHDVDQIKIVGGASEDGLVSMFSAVAEDDAAVREMGGISVTLRGTGGAGIELRQRGLLNISPDEGDPGAAVRTLQESVGELDLPELARFAFTGATPDEIAGAAASDEPAVEPVEAFIEAYRELHGRVTEGVDDPAGSLVHGLRLSAEDPYKTVRSYIESFFHLPRWMQISVLENVLQDPNRADHQMFLDQFSGNDLAELLPELGDEASEQLLGYAVEVAGDDAGHPLDLLAGLSSTTDVDEARKAVADRVSSVLAARDENEERLADLRTVMAVPFEDRILEREALRELFECEDRRERFSRVARVWTARIGRYIRDGDLERAAFLLDLGSGDGAYRGDHEDLVRKSLERLTTPELLKSLATEQGGGQEAAAQRLLTGLGRQVIDELVIQLASEEDAATRRQLTELLAAAARDEPEAIEPYLRDQRWYVTRNLVTALGHTGNRSAAKSVRLVIGHADHRVRTEALRAMVTLLQAEAATMVVAAMSDPNDAVRQTSVALLRGGALGEYDAVVADEVRTGTMPTDSAVVAVRIIGSRGRPQGITLLEELSSRRLAWRSRDRMLRRVSAEMLKERK